MKRSSTGKQKENDFEKIEVSQQVEQQRFKKHELCIIATADNI